MSEPWSDERVEKFKQLYAEGLSHSVIAERLGGITRNGSIGKANRLGLPTRKHLANGSHSAGRPRRPRHNHGKSFQFGFARKPKAPRQRAMAERASVSSSADAPLSLNITLENLEPHHCRFPYGNRAPFQFCGHEPREGSSYCEHHALICGGWHR